jgi:transcription elongation factor GreA
MAKKITTVTKKGFKELKDKLDHLKNVKRPEAAARVGVARSYGDLAENSEYDDAKNEQALIEAQIAELEETIANVHVVEHITQVKVFYVEDDEEVEYKIVGSYEVDLLNNFISDQCPIGAALIKSKAGDDITVPTPGGMVSLKVLEVKKVEE